MADRRLIYTKLTATGFLLFIISCVYRTNRIDRDCQIADFGFAASGLRGTTCHSIVGSRTYMAPEVISPQVNDYGVELGYDPAKVRGLRGDMMMVMLVMIRRRMTIGGRDDDDGTSSGLWLVVHPSRLLGANCCVPWDRVGGM